MEIVTLTSRRVVLATIGTQEVNEIDAYLMEIEMKLVTDDSTRIMGSLQNLSL